MTIVELLFMYTVPGEQDKVVCHILTQIKKKKKRKISFRGPRPNSNPNCDTMPWPFGYKALLTIMVHCTFFNASTSHDTYYNERYVLWRIVIMSWWCNLGNGDMENHPTVPSTMGKGGGGENTK